MQKNLPCYHEIIKMEEEYNRIMRANGGSRRISLATSTASSPQKFVSRRGSTGADTTDIFPVKSGRLQRHSSTKHVDRSNSESIIEDVAQDEAVPDETKVDTRVDHATPKRFISPRRRKVIGTSSRNMKVHCSVSTQFDVGAVEDSADEINCGQNGITKRVTSPRRRGTSSKQSRSSSFRVEGNTSSSGSDEDIRNDRGREIKKGNQKKSSRSASKICNEIEFDDVDTTTPEWKKKLLTQYIQLDADRQVESKSDNDEDSIGLESLSISDISDCLDFGKKSFQKSMNFIVAQHKRSPPNRNVNSSSVHYFDNEWTRLKEVELAKTMSTSDDGYDSMLPPNTMDTFTSPVKKNPKKCGTASLIMDLSPQHKNTVLELNKNNSPCVKLSPNTDVFRTMHQKGTILQKRESQSKLTNVSCHESIIPVDIAELSSNSFSISSNGEPNIDLFGKSTVNESEGKTIVPSLLMPSKSQIRNTPWIPKEDEFILSPKEEGGNMRRSSHYARSNNKDDFDAMVTSFDDDCFFQKPCYEIFDPFADVEGAQSKVVAKSEYNDFETLASNIIVNSAINSSGDLGKLLHTNNYSICNSIHSNDTQTTSMTSSASLLSAQRQRSSRRSKSEMVSPAKTNKSKPPLRSRSTDLHPTADKSSRRIGSSN